MLNFLKKLQTKTLDKPLGGRYQVIRQLSAGGFGQTFVAQDMHLPGHPVCAIKQFNPQVSDLSSFQTAQRLFDTEAKVLYTLGNHDQIPRLMAHFEDNQEFYLAQEFIDGEPLSDVIADGKPWSQGRVIAFLQDLLHVLAFVHQQNVIHRDIKPSNLLCRRRDGRIVLIDFGAVKQVNTQFFNPQTGKTNLTVSIGTQGYMPNEQLAGTPHFSSDVYAVGVIGIQTLTGVQPKHLGQNPLTGELDWRDAVSGSIDSGLIDVLNRMVRYDFRARYPTAAKALAAIQELAAEMSELIPKAWYIPSSERTDAAETPTAATPTPVKDTSKVDESTLTLPMKRQAIAHASSQPQSSQAPKRDDTPSQAILAAFERHQAERLTAARKPQGSTLATTLVLRTFPQRWGWWLGAFAGLGALLFTVKTCSSSHPTEQTAIALPSAETSPASQGANPSPAAADSADAQSDSQGATTEVPPTTEALLSKANELRNSGKYDQALVVYDEAIAEQPDSATAHWGRCYSLNRLEQVESAITACDQAIALDSKDPRPLSSKGYALQKQERHAEALTLFDQAIELQPNNAEAWNNRGTALLQLKQPEEALTALDKAIELQPDFAEAWNNRGAALWSLRRFDEALVSIDKALELRPDYRDAINLRQQMRDKLGR